MSLFQFFTLTKVFIKLREALRTLVCLRIHKHNSTTANKIAVQTVLSAGKSPAPVDIASAKVTELQD